jgi:hypothetical protein
MSPHRLFLLSPAHCGGKRASFLLNENASFDLARRIREPGGAALGEVFSFLSGLYFRGKVAYSDRFAVPPPNVAGSHVITTNRGLVPTHTIITIDDLRAMGCGDIDSGEATYREPLERDVRRLRDAAGDDCDFVLLGSVATGKYVDILLDILGPRLLFPIDFVGRGDMSRGGLMLRRVEEGLELEYAPVSSTVRCGRRPARLLPCRGQKSEVRGQTSEIKHRPLTSDL